MENIHKRGKNHGMNPYQPTYIKARTERDPLSQEFVPTARENNLYNGMETETNGNW